MQIPKEILAALIALVGIVLSVTISSLTSRRIIKVELSKLRFQIKGAYVEELLKTRISAYPRLYSHLAAFVRRIQYREVTVQEIEMLLRSIEAWDLENTIFLSSNSVKHFIALQNNLASLTSQAVVLPDLISTREFDRDMLNLIGSLQLALRADIGIYGLEFSNTEDEGKPVMPESWYE